ncbi:MAG: benzoylformate decarboxylase [Alphaproteobacteria bacterium]|nr:benzoylformate decarboxylase [Alphaproteobacteria bacterium]
MAAEADHEAQPDVGLKTNRETVRSATVKLLRELGVTTIFGNPGSTELPMFRDFPDDFRYVLGLQEASVLGMADGFAQATRNAALINLHSAAGLGHALGNLFTARKNQTPLIVIAGQQARSLLPFEPFLFAERATEFPQPHVKWACEPARAQDVPAAIARAYYVAMQPPRGPVFLSIPMDDWDEPAEAVEVRRVADRIADASGLIDEAIVALAEARTPAFVAGPGIALEDAWDEMIALAEKHRARVWVSPNSPRNSFPEDHPLFAGFLPADRRHVVASLEGSDVILVIGAPAFVYHVEGSGPHVPEGAQLFQFVDDPAVATWAANGTAITTSIKPALQALLKAERSPQRVEPPARQPVAPPSGAALTEPFLMHRIAANRPANSIIVEEAPSSRPALQTHLPIVRRDGFYTSASGGLGFSLPAAVGIALGRPGEKVIGLLGDGSSLYSIQGLWSAAQLKLAISFIIVNNNGYSALKAFGQRFGLGNPVGSDIVGVDFCKIAEGQGLTARRVDDPAQLDEALRWSFDEAGPTLIEVLTVADPDARPWWAES